MLWRIIASALVFVVTSLSGTDQARADLAGRYNGVDAAEGMSLRFSGSGDRLSAEFSAPGQSGDKLSVDASGAGAQATGRWKGGNAYFVFTEEPLGLTLYVMPIGADGLTRAVDAEAMIFLRDGIAAPPRPARYVGPPSGPGGTIDPRAFIESYGFWPSENVAYGYSMVRGRYRTLIRLHPVVQADILWKLCRTNVAAATLADALRGQAVSCDDVLDAFGRMLKPGGSVKPFNQFRAEAEAQKAALVEAILCSIDYKRNDPECRRSGASVAQAAASLVTVKSVLERY